MGNPFGDDEVGGNPFGDTVVGGGNPFGDAPAAEGGFIASAKQSVGSTIKGAGQVAADYLPGVGQDNPVKAYGQEVIDANPTAIKGFSDIAEKPLTTVKEAVGNAAPSMAGMVGARVAGTAITAASPLAGPFAPVVAGIGQVVSWLGPAAIAALPSYGGIRDTQMLNDPELESDAKSKAIAALGAATVGAIEVKFGPQEWALSALTKEGRAALAEKFLATTVTKAVGKGVAVGGAVEGAEELVQNPIEQLASYQNPLTEESLTNTAFGATMGAIGGGVMGGAAGGLLRDEMRAKKRQETLETLRADGEQELQSALSGVDLSGEITPNYAAQQPSAPALTNPDLLEVDLAPEEIAVAKEQMKRVLSGTAHVAEVGEAVSDVADLNPRMDAQPFKKPDEDANMSEEVLARREETMQVNTLPHDQRPITASSNPEAIGLNLRQWQLRPGETTGLGGDDDNFSAPVRQAIVSTVDTWAKKWLGSEARVLINFDTFTDNTVGSYTQLTSGIHVITPKELVHWDKHVPDPTVDKVGYNQFTQQQALYSLTHEFGHALVMQRFGEGMPEGFSNLVKEVDAGRMLAGEELLAMPEAQAKVLAEYQMMKGMVLGGKLSAADFVEKWIGTWKAGRALMKRTDLANKTIYEHAKQALSKDGKTFEGATALDLIHAMGRDSNVDTATSDARAEAYFLSFQEYMAEQFSRYAYQNRIEQGTALGVFFQRALETLRAFFLSMKTVKGENGESVIKPGTSFTEWVNGLAHLNQLADGVQPGMKAIRKGKKKAKGKAKEETGVGALDPVVQKAVESNGEGANPVEEVAEDTLTKEELRKRVKELIHPDMAEYKELIGMLVRGQLMEVHLRLQEYITSSIKKDIDASKKVEFPLSARVEAAGLTPEELKQPHALAEASALWGKMKEKSPFFKKRFGDWENAPEHATKVVDANGVPKALWHGGPIEFEFFDHTLQGTSTFADSAKRAIFFSEKSETAEYYAKLSAFFTEGDSRQVVKPQLGRKAQALRKKVQALWAQQENLKSQILPLEDRLDELRALEEEAVGSVFAKLAQQRKSKALFGELEKKVQKLHEERTEITRQWYAADQAAKDFENNPENLVNAVPTVGRYYLDIRNPLVVDEAVYQDELFSDMIQRAIGSGHDGVVIKKAADPYHGDTIYMVFDPEQIKAEKNVGTFDATDNLFWDKDTPEGLALGETAGRVKSLAKKMGVPTKAVQALHFWHKMQDAVIQVQQKAFTNGNDGLQLFNIYLQKYMNLKNELLRRPDEIVKRWGKLGKENSARLNRMLQDEFMSGGHVTELKMLDGVLTHTAGVAYREWAKSHGIDPVSAMGLEVEQLFLDVKNSLLKHVGTLEEIAIGIARDRFRNAPQALQLRVNEIRAEGRKWKETPFMPQSRFGQFVVKVKGRNPETGMIETLHQEHFETKAERQEAARRFAALAQKGERIVESELDDTTYVVMSFPKEFLQTLADTQEFTDEQITLIGDSMTPVRGSKLFARYEREGSKIRGASNDLMRNFAHWSWHNSNFLAKLQFRRKLNSAIALTRSDITQVNNSGLPIAERQKEVHELDRVVGIMSAAREYIMHPPAEFFKTRATVSLLYLMYNVKTALMNTMGMLNTWAAVTSQYGDLRGNGIFIKATKDLVSGNLTVQEKWMLDKALDDGVVDQSYAYFLAGQANAGNLSRMVKTTPGGELWKNFSEFGMKPFQLIEMANRKLTMLMIFRAELRNGLAAGLIPEEARQEAYSEAERKTRLLQNDYAPGNRPQLLQGKKSIFFIFFSYTQFMLWIMSGGYERGVRAQQKKNGETPRNVMAGMTVRMWLIFLLLSGAEGLPFGENLIDMISWVWRKLFKGENLRVEARKFLEGMGADSNLVLHGLAHDAAGFDLSGSIGMGRVLPGTDILTRPGLKPDEVVGKMAAAAPGPLGGVLKNLLGLLTSEEPVGKRLAHNLPGAMGSVAKAVDFSLHGAESKRGANLAIEDDGTPRDLSPKEIIGQGLGFRPAILAKNQELNALKYEEHAYWTERRSGLKRHYWEAWRQKDREGVADVRKAVEEFNAEVPSPALKITGKEINLSIKARVKARAMEEKGLTGGKRYQGLDKELTPLVRNDSSE